MVTVLGWHGAWSGGIETAPGPGLLRQVHAREHRPQFQVPPTFGFGNCPFRFVRLAVLRAGFTLALHGFKLGPLARGRGVVVGDRPNTRSNSSFVAAVSLAFALLTSASTTAAISSG
jgi:hypothetical protein